jgi:hypothetical protein
MLVSNTGLLLVVHHLRFQCKPHTLQLAFKPPCPAPMLAVKAAAVPPLQENINNRPGVGDLYLAVMDALHAVEPSVSGRPLGPACLLA